MKLLAKVRFARLWIMLLFTSLSMVPVSTVAFAVSIGEQYQGGIVFYVDESRQHGLIAATRDLPGEYEWQGAKEACERFVHGGFSDWYLPSRWELNQLYMHKNAVAGFPDGYSYYWSSSEAKASAGNAWGQNFSNGNQGQDGKASINVRVRAVRAF